MAIYQCPFFYIFILQKISCRFGWWLHLQLALHLQKCFLSYSYRTHALVFYNLPWISKLEIKTKNNKTKYAININNKKITPIPQFNPKPIPISIVAHLYNDRKTMRGKFVIRDAQSEIFHEFCGIYFYIFIFLLIKDSLFFAFISSR